MRHTFKGRFIATCSALLMVLGNGLFAGKAGAFDPDPTHEDLTKNALSFLRPGVLDDIQDEHAGWADAFFGDAKNVPWVHFDGCSFGESAEQINRFYAQAVHNLVPGSGFQPWSATDDFGRVFHPVQDFYSHSNWVELGFPATDDPSTTTVEVEIDDLVDFSTRLADPSALGLPGLGAWRTPPPLGTVRGDILLDDLVVTTLVDDPPGGALEAESATIYEIPPAWNLGLLEHPDLLGQPGYVPGIDTTGDAEFKDIPTEGDYPIPIMTKGMDKRFLTTGVGARPVGSEVKNQCDPYRRDANGNVIAPAAVNSCWPPDEFGFDPADYYSCIAYHGSRFALTHADLAKDNSDAGERFLQARALAQFQSRYEWCRFVNQAGLSGADGLLLTLWVDEGKAANPPGTPCNADPADGPKGVTVEITKVEVLDDKDDEGDEPGELNLSLALYDDPAAFHRLAKSPQPANGAVAVDEDGTKAPRVVPAWALPDPVSQCVNTADSTFRAALHGWDDDDSPNGDYNQNGDSPGGANVDDAVIGFSERLSANIPLGTTIPGKATSTDLYVEYTVTRIADDDVDGLDECGEGFHGTDVANPDHDGDGLLDGTEVNGSNPTQPLVADSDGDGLNDGREDANSNGVLDAGETNPNDSDSDDDGLSDGVELLGTNPTNPLDADSDNDGLSDGLEDVNANGGLDFGETNPNDDDSDNDELLDGQEVTVGTDPLDADSDNDGILDGSDVEWIQGAIAGIPTSALKDGDEGLRTAMISLLDGAEKRIAKGDIGGALSTLQSLRKRIDGCGSKADKNDWIVVCPVQIEVRALVDILIDNIS